MARRWRLALEIATRWKLSAPDLDRALIEEVEALSNTMGDSMTQAVIGVASNSKLPACPLLHEAIQAPNIALIPVGTMDQRFGFALAGRDINAGFEANDISILQSFGDYMAVMTDNRRRQAALVAQERHFHAAFTNTPVMMYAIDKESRFVSVRAHPV